MIIGFGVCLFAEMQMFALAQGGFVMAGTRGS
jgi:hypothetical protein